MAQTTPNFGFIIAEGTDTVNLLTQCYPNFTSLDSILQGIKETGVTSAVDTKVGTVHQLVRTDSDCIRFSFVATGNYNSGDTFTVDGNVVTATTMDGASLPQGAFVINQSVFCILNGLVLTVIGVKGADSLAASAVTYDNTASGIAATDVQDAIDELAPKGSVSITTNGTRTYGQELERLWALIDTSKVSENSVFNNNGILMRLIRKSNTILQFTTLSVDSSSASLSMITVRASNCSYRSATIDSTPAFSVTEFNTTLAAAGVVFEVIY